MALPTTITATNSQFLRNFYMGPFKSSAGNIYGIFSHGTSSYIRAMKATDPTDSFSEQDSANRPTMGTAPSASTWVYQVGDVLHIGTHTGSAGAVHYHTFNMGADTWGTVDELIEDIPNGGAIRPSCSIALRSDGDVIVAYDGDTEKVMGTDYARIVYGREEGAGWTSGIAVSATGTELNYQSVSIVLGSSDRMHIFWASNAPTVFHRSLNSSNNLSSIDTVATPDTEVYIFQRGVSYVSGGTKVRQAYRDVSNTLSVIKFDSADSPSISIDSNILSNTVSAGTSSGLETSSHCMAVDGSKIYVVYSDLSTEDLYIDSNDNDGGWGTDVEIEDAITADRISANIYDRNGLKLAYFRSGDAADVVYNEYALTAAPVGQPPRVLMPATRMYQHLIVR